jgi:hypothetical protein
LRPVPTRPDASLPVDAPRDAGRPDGVLASGGGHDAGTELREDTGSGPVAPTQGPKRRATTLRLVSVTGGLQEAAARKVLGTLRRPLARCLERSPAGALQLFLMVRPTGEVASAGIRPEPSGKAKACVEAAARRLRFPAASSQSVVRAAVGP